MGSDGVAMGGCPAASPRPYRPYMNLGSVSVNDKAELVRNFASIASQIATARSGPPSRLIALIPVGEVTLISVRWPSMTSIPAKSRPRRLSSGPMAAQISCSRARELRRRRGAAAHQIGADVVFGRNPVDRAGRHAIDEDDALVALGHLRQKALDDPWLAKARREKIVKRAKIRILAGDFEHRRAAMPMQGLHHRLAMLVKKGLDGRLVAGDQGRRHKLRKIHDKELFRRIAHAGRIIDDQHVWLHMLKQMRRGDIGEIERRILAQKDDVERGEIERLCLAQGEMIAFDIAHLERRRHGHDPAVRAAKACRACSKRADGRARALRAAERRSNRPRY